MKKAFQRFLTLSIVLALTLSFCITPAYAYSIKKTDSNITLCGIGKYAPITIYADVTMPQMYITALTMGINVWNSAGYGTLLKYGGTKSMGIVAEDGISTFCIIDDSILFPFPEDNWKGHLGATKLFPERRLLPNIGKLYIAEFDIGIHNSNNYFLEPNNPVIAYDILGVVIHELGHGLGFDDVKIKNSVMYEDLVEYDTSFRTLKYDDFVGLNYLYGTGSEDTMIPPTDKPDPDPGFNPDPDPPHKPGEGESSSSSSSSEGSGEITDGPGRPE